MRGGYVRYHRSRIAGYPEISLPSGSSAAAGSCHRCEAYRPDPQPSGNLRVDPEIHLPSPGMDVDIAYYYNANSSANGAFGYGRTLSTNLTAIASGSPAIVTIARGNGALVSYQDDGTGNFVSANAGCVEYFEQGTVTAGGYWQGDVPPTAAPPLFLSLPTGQYANSASFLCAGCGVAKEAQFLVFLGSITNPGGCRRKICLLQLQQRPAFAVDSKIGRPGVRSFCIIQPACPALRCWRLLSARPGARRPTSITMCRC